MNKELINISILLKKYCNEFKKNKYRIVNRKGKVYSSFSLFLYYFLLKKEFNSNPLSSILKNIIVNSEKFFPGSSFYLCEMIYKNVIHNKKFKEFHNKQELTLQNVFKFYENKYDKNTLDLIKEIIKISGPDCNIICEKTNNSKIEVVRTQNSQFNFKCHKSFTDIYFSSKQKVDKSLFVTVLDSYLEREIDLIPAIEKASINKKNLLVFVRGISNSAISNIKKIMLKNNIVIYIYPLKFDNEDPFALKDIASSLEIKYLSPDKGSIIVRDIEENTKYVENIVLYKDKIELKKSNINELNKLNSQIKECRDENLLNYLNFRKKRFSCKKTTIFVPEVESFFMQDIKDFINTYNNLIKYGIINIEGYLQSYKCYNNNIKLMNLFIDQSNKIGITIKEK